MSNSSIPFVSLGLTLAFDYSLFAMALLDKACD
jgi:hypothetical protein